MSSAAPSFAPRSSSSGAPSRRTSSSPKSTPSPSVSIPAYLDDLGPDFTADLPPERPFRVTYFYGRHGLGYHIGFSDIARGGWRTIITETRDDYVTAANTLFRENYVLAHTQHLKNKDIYEGGSKLVVVLRAPDLPTKEQLNQLLYKIQYGFINAFLDIFVSTDGKVKDPRVVDYYGEDEAIELGPDENMHDLMIETIAELSVKRGYVLGIGIMSSKVVGINHKQYGVTSTGVVTFAEIAMREQGIDIRKDPFSVKFTGGPNGDVAGNAMRLLLERCPRVAVRLIVDGTGALVDPNGLDRGELSRIVLKEDVEGLRSGPAFPRGVSALPERPPNRGTARTLQAGRADGSRSGGGMGHAGRVPEGIHRTALHRAGGPVHPGRRSSRDRGSVKLGAVLLVRTGRRRPG